MTDRPGLTGGIVEVAGCDSIVACQMRLVAQQRMQARGNGEALLGQTDGRIEQVFQALAAPTSWAW